MHKIKISWQSGRTEKKKYEEYRLALQTFSQLLHVPEEPLDTAEFDGMMYYGKGRITDIKENKIETKSV